ncbi:MAG: nucleotide exchange factor GrpE, partial [Flavobacteriaceae bacterium]|nr:nucleotide exchange factor GrpE [Flavobacteriaceae bacterium]
MAKKDKTEEIVEEQLDTTAANSEKEAESSDQEKKDTLSQEEKLQSELQTEKDKFLRLFAEFENYKKRTNRERIELFKTASQDVMQSLLPILDDFDRAYSEIAKTSEKELLKGVELISNKLRDTLR